MPSASAPMSGASNGNSAGTSSGGYGTAASSARRRPSRNWSHERTMPPPTALRRGLHVGGEPDLRARERPVEFSAEREVLPAGHGGSEVDAVLARDAEGTGADGGQPAAGRVGVEQGARGVDAAL